MARGKSEDKITSITEPAASKHMAKAKVGALLFCKQIHNFHLLKQKKGCAWRLRYMDANGKLRTATIGRFPAMQPDEAASIAKEWRDNDRDILREKASRKHQRHQAAQEADSRILSTYLHGIYKQQWLAAWKEQNAKALVAKFEGGNLSRFAGLDMGEITKGMVRQWQADMAAKGLKHATIKRDFNDLRAVLNRAVADEVLADNPIKGHKLNPPPAGKTATESGDKDKRRLLTDAEVKGILNGLELFADEIRAQRRNSRAHGKPDLPDLDAAHHPHWFIPFCHLALHTGLRPGDLFSLRWEELNVRFGRLTKVCEKTSHAARSGKKPAVVDMKLNDTIKQIMSEWHKDCGKPVSGLVFESPRTGRELDSLAHRKPWAHVKRLGGLDEKLEFYSLRHHFISALLTAGVPIFTVAKLVGHKSTAMIEQHYGHLCPDQAAVALDIVAASVTGSKAAGRAAK
jgi:integrase